MTLSQNSAFRARMEVIEGGPVPHWVDPILAQSWMRCSTAHHRPGHRPDFINVPHAFYQDLLDTNRTVVLAAKRVLPRILQALEGLRCGVMITDPNAVVLASLMSNQVDAGLRKAMRGGLDLSEQIVGTNAMDLSIRAGRVFSVSGDEHFLSSIHNLHCISVPIRHPAGTLVGALDVTSEMPLPFDFLQTVLARAAHSVERDLFEAIPCAHRLRIAPGGFESGDGEIALLGLGEQGDIQAANPAARRLIGGTAEIDDEPLHFHRLFGQTFGTVFDRLRIDNQPRPLRLLSGVTVFAQLDAREGRNPPGSGSSHRANPVKTPLQFGDDATERSLAKALTAFDFGLPILLNGPTGSGKEVAARWLHANSARKSGPFIALNCAAIPEGLIESELFGYEDGAFTGARKGGAPGKIELAERGILFLDEIGDMPIALQARLLRVLEDRQTTRLGGRTSIKVDFHLICATHQTLSDAIAQRRFREDLYYRINGLKVVLKPLVERNRFSQFVKAQFEAEVGPIARLTSDAEQRLLAHPWPGNARELRNVFRFLRATVADGTAITTDHLPDDLIGSVPSPAVEDRVASNLLAAREHEMIEDLVLRCNGNVAAAAKLLGLSRATLYRRLKARSKSGRTA